MFCALAVIASASSMVPASAWAQAPCPAAGTVTPVQRVLQPRLAPCSDMAAPPPGRSTGAGVGVYAAAIALGVGAGAAINELADIDDTLRRPSRAMLTPRRGPYPLRA